MTTEPVEVERDGHVATVTLSRAEQMNTFSTPLADALDDALGELDADDAVRAVVVSGAGRAFSAGIDLTEYADRDGYDDYLSWVGRMEEPFRTIAHMRTPLVAAAHGHAAANGIGLVAASDLAIVADGTQLGATAPKVGLFCMGPAVPLMRSLGQKRCLELLLTGDLIDADTALDWGLVNRVVPEPDLLDEALALAERIASKSPVAVQMGKQAYYEMADMGYDDALDYSNERFAELCANRDAHDGIEAFLAGDPLDADDWPGE